MPNIHKDYGEKASQWAIVNADEHRITMTRGATVTPEFSAGSPPIAHEVQLSIEVMHISEHNRTFWWKVGDNGDLGMPQRGDLITEVSDGTTWKLLPNNQDDFWEWHGVGKSMIRVKTKQVQA